MNEHAEDPLLRSLDVAATTLTPSERERSVATLDRILATPRSTERSTAPAPPSPVRRSWRVLVLTALVLIVGLLAAQSIAGPDRAYASWTASPEPVAAGDLEVAAAPCRARFAGSYLDIDHAALVLAERRGDFVILLYRTDDPDVSGSCLVRNPQGTTDVDVIGSGTGGSSGPAQPAPARSFTEGAIAQYDGVSVTDGAAGADVVGVTIHAGTLSVTASVRGGRYAAWWPGAAFAAGPPQPSGQGGPEPILTYDLTLTDGTVLRDARPTFPS